MDDNHECTQRDATEDVRTERHDSQALRRTPPAASGTLLAQANTNATPATTAPPLEAIRHITNNLTLTGDGDDYEKHFWPAICADFPNYERFWRDLVTPTTNRIERAMDAPGRHERRDTIADDLWNITYTNYSVFLNLAAAHEHLTRPLTFSLGNFYTHLATACELADDFLLRAYRLTSDCKGTQIPELAPRTKQDFLDDVAHWYDKHYKKSYAHYHANGKSMIVHVSPTERILAGYHNTRPDVWKDYLAFREPIKHYRNKVVHDVQLGTIRINDVNLMPRPEKIIVYSTMTALRNAITDPRVLATDFVVREAQMQADVTACKQHLNRLWEQPTNDLTNLLYEDHNPVLLQKYDLRYSTTG